MAQCESVCVCWCARPVVCVWITEEVLAGITSTPSLWTRRILHGACWKRQILHASYRFWGDLPTRSNLLWPQKIWSRLSYLKMCRKGRLIVMYLGKEIWVLLPPLSFLFGCKGAWGEHIRTFYWIQHGRLNMRSTSSSSCLFSDLTYLCCVSAALAGRSSQERQGGVHLK